MWCQGLCWGHTSVPLHACCPTQCLHRAARGCLWGGGTGLSCRGEGTQRHRAAGLGPQNHSGTQLAAALSSPCLAPRCPLCCSVTAPPQQDGGENSYTVPGLRQKNTLFFPCVKPTDSKLCVLMAAHQMQVSLHTWEQLLNSASLSP